MIVFGVVKDGVLEILAVQCKTCGSTFKTINFKSEICPSCEEKTQKNMDMIRVGEV